MNYIRVYRMTILIFLLAVGLIAAQINAQNDADIILTWSSSSFAPAGYPGKHLPSSGSQIIVSASPEILLRGTNLKPQDLTYRWFLDYRLQSAASGQGQQDFSFAASGSKGTTINIKVEIQNPAGVLLGQKSLKITLAEPTVQIHHLFENQFIGTAFKNAAEMPPGQKINFIAIPYFFNIAGAAQIDFSWRANNQPIFPDPRKRPDIAHLEIDSEMPPGAIYDLVAAVQNNIRKNETASAFLRINVR